MSGLFSSKKALFLAILTIFTSIYAYTEENEAKAFNFFIAPVAEINGYGYSAPSWAFGGAIAAGYDTWSIGLRYLYSQDKDFWVSQEYVLFMREYIWRALFLQGEIGIVFYSDGESGNSGYGNVSVSFCVGWRFRIGKYFFTEPMLRVGLQHIFGVGLSAGFRIGK